MASNVHSACSDVEYAYYRHLSEKKDVALKDEDVHSIDNTVGIYIVINNVANIEIK